MTDADLVDRFFEELSRRGHDPLLDRAESTGRFEIVRGEHTDRWLVTVKGGYITVSRGDGDADWVMRADRGAFNRVIHGDAGALAALVRGTLSVTFEADAYRLGLLVRLFAGPQESRKQWIKDPRWQEDRQEDWQEEPQG
jgi:SCP-2 sterol transfer family